MTDLCQIFRVGRTTAVDDLSVISFSIPQGMLPQQPIFVGFIYRITYIMHFCGCHNNQFLLALSTDLHILCISVALSTELIHWTQVASSAGGRANVGLFTASSLCSWNMVYNN